MPKLKKIVAIIFLTVFVAVKVSPDYYRDQLLAALSTGNLAPVTAHYRTSRNENLLVRIQKGIVEDNTFKTIPAIKFSGVIFALALLGPCLISSGTYQNFLSLKSAIGKPKKYLLQGVLRL